MSETTEAEEKPQENIEARARRLGWKPQNEFNGDVSHWRSAEDFIKVGEEELPVIRDRNRLLERKMEALERRTRESSELLQEMTNRVRTADERALRKARVELEAERIKAVEIGDKDAFNKADRELNDLNKEAAAAPRQKPGALPAAVPPEVLEWGQRNQWFHSDSQLQKEAQQIHMNLQNSNPGLSLSENLDRVTKSMAALYPDRVQVGHAAPSSPRVVTDDNPRRSEPSAVSSSTPTQTRSTAGDRTFEKLPKDAKDAYHKYAKQLEGKGKPLTKEEWCSTYYEDEA